VRSIFAAGAAAGTRGMRKLSAVPSSATATTMTPNQPQPIFPRVEHEAAARDADDDRHERAHFEDTVGARQVAIGEHLRQDSVFRGLKNVACSAIRKSTA